MLLYGALVGLPVLRLRGHYFAIATLGVAIATREITNNLEIFGASRPLNLPLKNDPNLFYYLALGLLVVAIALTYLIARSKLGYGLVAIRENEDAALVMGINTTIYKVIAFALNAMLCGLAGGVYAYWHSTIDPPTVFDLTNNVRIIIMAVLGGIGTPLGPIIGARCSPHPGDALEILHEPPRGPLRRGDRRRRPADAARHRLSHPAEVLVARLRPQPAPISGVNIFDRESAQRAPGRTRRPEGDTKRKTIRGRIAWHRICIPPFSFSFPLRVLPGALWADSRLRFRDTDG